MNKDVAEKIALNSMELILTDKKYDENMIKKLSEYISCDIRDKLHIASKEFEGVVATFVYKADYKNYVLNINEELNNPNGFHFQVKYSNTEYQCLSAIFGFNRNGKNLENPLCKFSDDFKLVEEFIRKTQMKYLEGTGEYKPEVSNKFSQAIFNDAIEFTKEKFKNFGVGLYLFLQDKKINSYIYVAWHKNENSNFLGHNYEDNHYRSYMAIYGFI